jgi:hypothetical protein
VAHLHVLLYFKQKFVCSVAPDNYYGRQCVCVCVPYITYKVTRSIETLRFGYGFAVWQWRSAVGFSTRKAEINSSLPF